MKANNIMRFAGGLLLFVGIAIIRSHAQNAHNTNITNQPPPTPTVWKIAKREANHRLWSRTVYERLPSGKTISHPRSYVEIGSGLCYRDPSSGQWLDAEEKIETIGAGAVARHTRYQTIFGDNLNSAGVIDQQTPDAKRLRSSILGLAYLDTATGQTVVFAHVQDSHGELISDNQVLYPNAFKGVKADVRYTHRKGTFEQDVILREQPPIPESFGLNSATTEIEVLTEFIDPPAAKISEHRWCSNSLPDDEISWGVTHIGQGKAFELGTSAPPFPPIRVRREFKTIQDRHILVEGVPLPQIQRHLSLLPQQSSMQNRNHSLVAKALILPKSPVARANPKPIKMAVAPPSASGFVLDYVEVNSAETNFTFQGDTTYYVSSEYDLLGTTTIEGGTVIKYGNIYGSGRIRHIVSSGQFDIDVDGAINCQTGPYKPAVFTSMNDDSLGQPVDGSTGSPSAGDTDGYYLEICTTNAALHDLRFNYASVAVYHDYPTTPAEIDIRDSQFNQVDAAIYGYNVGLKNVLIDSSGLLGDNAIYCEGPNFSAENITSDNGCNSNYLVEADYPGTASLNWFLDVCNGC